MHNDLGFDIWCGLDVGKQAHHACALDAAGKKVFDKPLPQDQSKLEDLFTRLSEHGRVLVIVDQPNTIGALPIAVARSMGMQVAYLPGLAMRRAADLERSRFGGGWDVFRGFLILGGTDDGIDTEGVHGGVQSVSGRVRVE